MRIFKIMLPGLGIMVSALFYLSCSKDHGKNVAPLEEDFNNSALVQVFNATVSSTRTYIYVDGVPVTGATLTYGNVFPGGGAFAFKVKGGLRAFLIKDTLLTSTQAQIAFSENFQSGQGKTYTIFMYDTTTIAKQLTVENTMVIPSDTTARLKFANFIYNSGGTPAVDVFSVKKNANLFTNVSKTQVTDFIPYASGVSDTLLVRETGTTNLLASLNSFNATLKRSYTIIYRGSFKGTRALSAFPNN